MKYTINGGTEPMQIEVPSDMYDSAVQAMENRIRNDEVPGVKNPQEAKNIVRKGHFTYKQAMNIAKAGTVESITYDAVNGAIVSTYAFGITSALTFATSLWNGESVDIALKQSALSGIKVGGTSFVTAVLSSQQSKAGLNSLLIGSSEAVVNIIGPKASAVLVNAFRSGSNIYGVAAMKSAAKMLRGNTITGAVSVVVLSSFDVVNIFRGRISGKQLFKNIANTTATVAGEGKGLRIPLSDDVDINELAEKYEFCGREIKKSVKDACVVTAIAESEFVSQETLIKSAEKTRIEYEKVMSAEDHTVVKKELTDEQKDVLKEAMQKKIDEAKTVKANEI